MNTVRLSILQRILRILSIKARSSDCGMERKIKMMFVKAFLVGGLICGLVQILMDRTKLLPGRIMVLLVCLGITAGVLGIYKPLVDFAGAGATVPLCGFGYTLWEGVRNAINEEGFIGVFKGGFNASSIGISASLLISYLASLIFNPKMKK